MRIALVFKRFSRHGGSERQLHLLAAHLAEQGDDVHVYCSSVRAQTPPGVTLHRMTWRPPGHMLQMATFSAWAKQAIARDARKNGRFDITHAFGRTLGQDVYRVGGGCHLTYLSHAHALDRPASLRWLSRRSPYQLLKANMEARALQAEATRGIITNSNMARDDLIASYGLDADRLHVVRNGVDLARFRPPRPGERDALRSAISLAPQDEVVLFLGTGYARKGLDVALRAVARLAPARPALQFIVMGNDTRGRHWRNFVQQLGIGGRVRLLGPADEPERAYRLADVYLLPTAYDPAANTTLEALASGTPVVTSAMNGAAEIIDTASYGSVLPNPVHPDDIAAALQHWLDLPDQAAVRRAARARAEQFPTGSSSGAIRRLYLDWIEAGQASATPTVAK